MTIMSFEEDYLIVYRGGATCVGELGHGLKPPISINLSIWCVMEFPIQWDVVMEILGVLLGLVKNYERHEAFHISSGKEK